MSHCRSRVAHFLRLSRGSTKRYPVAQRGRACYAEALERLRGLERVIANCGSGRSTLRPHPNRWTLAAMQALSEVVERGGTLGGWRRDRPCCGADERGGMP